MPSTTAARSAAYGQETFQVPVIGCAERPSGEEGGASVDPLSRLGAQIAESGAAFWEARCQARKPPTGSGCRDDACGTSAAVFLEGCHRGGESISAKQAYELVERERGAIQVGCLLREDLGNPGGREIHQVLDEAVR
jgi:hypothetical protein